MNKQTIKVLLASGAFTVVAIFSGCNNGNPETCPCQPNGKEYAYPNVCPCSGVDCNCKSVLRHSTYNLVFEVPASGLSSSEENAINQFLTLLDLDNDYGAKFKNTGLIVVIKDGISTWQPGESIGKVYIPKSSLASSLLIDQAVVAYSNTISLKQFNFSKETTRLVRQIPASAKPGIIGLL